MTAESTAEYYGAHQHISKIYWYSTFTM